MRTKRYYIQLLVFFFILPVFFQEAPLDAQEEIRILVYPFKNNSSSAHSWISAGMTDTVISDLSRLQNINVITSEDRKKAIRELELSMTGLVSDETTVKVGKITGANMIFTGSYMVSGKKIRVTGRLIDVASSVIKKSIKEDGILDNLFELQDKVVLAMMSETEKIKIRNVRKVTFREDQKRNVRKGFKPGLDAYRFYSLGLVAIEKNPARALTYFKKALKREPDYFDALLATGDMYNVRGKPDEALKCYVRAEGLIRKAGMKKSIKAALLANSIGNFYWNRGRYRKAMEYAEKNLNILKAKGKRRSYLAAVTGLHLAASACRGLKKMNRAEEYYREAESILSRGGFRKTTGYAWVLVNLGALHMNMGNYRGALSWYQRAISTWKSIGLGNSQGVAYGECEMGYVYSGMGKHRTGINFLKKGLRRCERLGLAGTANYAWYNWYIAVIYYGKTNQACRAVPYMKKSAALFQRLNHSTAAGAQKALVDMQVRCRSRGR